MKYIPPIAQKFRPGSFGGARQVLRDVGCGFFEVRESGNWGEKRARCGIWTVDGTWESFLPAGYGNSTRARRDAGHFAGLKTSIEIHKKNVGKWFSRPPRFPNFSRGQRQLPRKGASCSHHFYEKFLSHTHSPSDQVAVLLQHRKRHSARASQHDENAVHGIGRSL